jgi:hypothetical protein
MRAKPLPEYERAAESGSDAMFVKKVRLDPADGAIPMMPKIQPKTSPRPTLITLAAVVHDDSVLMMHGPDALVAHERRSATKVLLGVALTENLIILCMIHHHTTNNSSSISAGTGVSTSTVLLYR